MTALQARVEDGFRKHFRAAPDLVVRAPGRVNLIGGQADYDGGLALSCAIGFGTVVAARRRADRVMRVVSLDSTESLDEFILRRPLEQSGDRMWANYVRGVADAMMSSCPMLGGADIAIGGDVPDSAGLSSSASLTVGIGEACRELFDLTDLSASDVALIAQRAETAFVGTSCGNLDQLASACGRKDHALLIDCRSVDVRPVRMPAGLSILIVESGAANGLGGSAARQRRDECAAAARLFGVWSLRDVDRDRLAAARKDVGDVVVLRRARHVVTESARTLDMAKALETGDLAALGPLMRQSHASLRDDFEMAVPKVDELVDIMAGAIGDIGGARMTGGGFGGCVVGLLPTDRVGKVQAALRARYRTPDGGEPRVYVCTAGAGARVLSRRTSSCATTRS